MILETFYDLSELREAIFAAREAAGPEMVIMAQVTVEDDGTLRDGTATGIFTRSLNEWPVDVIGVNCSAGPKVALETIEKMAAFTTKPLSAMPNAGLPANVEGRNIYLCSPEYMAQYARRFLQAGVRVIGGCCGTTPEHIKRSALKCVPCSRCSTARRRWNREKKASRRSQAAAQSSDGRKIATWAQSSRPVSSLRL